LDPATRGPQAETVRRAMAALGEPHRFELAATLLEGPISVGELTPRFGWPQSLVSHHIAILQRVGLIDMKREGRRRLYRLAAPRDPALRALFDIFVDSVRGGTAGASGAAGADRPGTYADRRTFEEELRHPIAEQGPREPEIEDYLL
jgi:DNA-binding transcriptional ArsR family regulator